MATFSEHQKRIAKLERELEAIDRAFFAFIKACYPHHYCNTPAIECRKIEDLTVASYRVDLEAAEAAIEAARDAAIADHCAWRDPRYGYAFQWYSPKDAAKWRRQAKKRAA